MKVNRQKILYISDTFLFAKQFTYKSIFFNTQTKGRYLPKGLAHLSQGQGEFRARLTLELTSNSTCI